MNNIFEAKGPDKPHIVDVKMIHDPRGTLGVLEGMKHIGFNFKRLYFLTNLSDQSERGGHAHKKLRQCLICLRGGVTIDLEGRGGAYQFRLENCEEALVIPPGHWRELKGFDTDSLVAVLASDYYDESDYIRDRKEFSETLQVKDVGKVPYIDMKRYVDFIRSELDEAIDQSLVSGTFIGGSTLRLFEEKFAEYCSVSASVGLANGYDALQLALLSQGVGPGDEVIVPAHTFVATALAVAQVGAVPVLVDVEADTGLIDVKAVEERVTARTRGIIPVHLYGHPVDMDPLIEIAARHKLFLLEDAAQAHGATYKGRKCGSLGDAAAFSFYPTKNLGALGDAGAVTSNDASLIGEIRKLGNYGAQEKYQHELLGMNSRLDPLQASILLRKMKYLDEWNDGRRRYAGQYLEGLRDIEGIQLPVVRSWADPVWHVFAIRLTKGHRDQLQASLAQSGIGTNIHYPTPIHRQKCFAGYNWSPNAFPNSDLFAQQSLSLPLDPLHTHDEIDTVIQHIRRFFEAA